MKKQLLYLVLCVFAITAANAQINSVSIVGSAVGGWPTDNSCGGPVDQNQMTRVAGTTDQWILENVVVVGGSGKLLKFRANNCWDGAPNGLNLGLPAGYTGAIWPSGVGINDGGSKAIGEVNGVLVVGGTYTVKLNTTTLAYSFESGVVIPVVNLVGTAVTGGTVAMTATSATTFNLDNTTLLAGNAQFEIDGVLSGDINFPTGTAAVGSTNIPVIAGSYLTITLDVDTGAYTFVAGYPTIDIIGNGTTGNQAGWGSPIVLATTDGITYTLKNLKLYATSSDSTPIAGAAAGVKFRLNNAWITNWGGTAFPKGPTAGNNDDIMVSAGTYDVTFNRTTGAYAFSFPTIDIIGNGTTGNQAGWASPIVMATTDGVNYSLKNLKLYATSSDSTPIAGAAAGVKFRLNNAWNTNWGGTAFPTGPTAGNNDDIMVSAGNFDVNFNRTTGVYNFTTALAVTKFDANTLSVYPNPTSNSWNFRAANTVIKSIQIFDINGKSVKTVSAKDSAATVDASALSKGVYFAKISSDTQSETVKLIKN